MPVVDFSLRMVFIFIVLCALKAAAWRERRTDKTVTWTHVEDAYTDKSQRKKKTSAGENVKAILCLNKLFARDTAGVPSVCLYVFASLHFVCVCVLKCI